MGRKQIIKASWEFILNAMGSCIGLHPLRNKCQERMKNVGDLLGFSHVKDKADWEKEGVVRPFRL